MWILETNLDLELGIHDAMNLRVSIPFKRTSVSAQFLDEHGDPLVDYNSIHHRNEIVLGIGDPVLVLDYDLMQRGALTGIDWTISAGLTFPLGNIQPNPFALGMKGEVHQHLMYGTGTFNPIAGTRIRYSGGGYSLMTWVDGQVPLYRNKYGMKGSSIISGGLGAFSNFGLASIGFLLQGEFVHIRAENWDDGFESPNTGRTDVIATAGVLWSISDTLSAHALVKVPFTVELSGGQLDVPLLVLVGLDKTFRLF